MKQFIINDRKIDKDHPAYIIAELSANHSGNLEQAKEIIHAMSEAGADAVKLQTYTADTLTIKCDKSEFQVSKGTLWEGRTLHDLYEEAHTPWAWHEELFQLANKLDLDCFSTPFDFSAVDFLEQFNPPLYKIASFELVDLPLIEYVASKGRPIIMSTGMGSLAEISEAVEVIKKFNTPLALLKCTSAYPSPPEAMNLRTIPHLAKTFNVPVGLSDHTMGISAPVAAVTIGAVIIEKHVTISRANPGPDSQFSLEPHEFRSMIQSVREAERSLGSVNYEITREEQSSLCFRRSLFVVKDIGAGEILTKENVRSIRPGYGLKPKNYNAVLGRKAKQPIERGTPLAWNLLS